MSSTTLTPYSATVILDTRNYDKEVGTLLERFKEALVQLGAEVTEAKNLGRFDFIRITDRNHPGDTYFEIEFNGPSGIAHELQEHFRLDRNIKRITVLRND